MLSVCWNFLPWPKTTARALPINTVKATTQRKLQLSSGVEFETPCVAGIPALKYFEVRKHRSNNLLSIFWWPMLASLWLGNCAQIATALKLAVFCIQEHILEHTRFQSEIMVLKVPHLLQKVLGTPYHFVKCWEILLIPSKQSHMISFLQFPSI